MSQVLKRRTMTGRSLLQQSSYSAIIFFSLDKDWFYFHSFYIESPCATPLHSPALFLLSFSQLLKCLNVKDSSISSYAFVLCRKVMISFSPSVYNGKVPIPWCNRTEPLQPPQPHCIMRLGPPHSRQTDWHPLKDFLVAGSLELSDWDGGTVDFGNMPGHF